MAKPKPPPKSKAPSAETGRTPTWLASALSAATQRGHYPRWVTAAVKAAIVIGVMTAVADWAAQRSAKAELARLVDQAAREPTKASAARR